MAGVYNSPKHANPGHKKKMKSTSLHTEKTSHQQYMERYKRLYGRKKKKTKEEDEKEKSLWERIIEMFGSGAVEKAAKR